MNLIKLDAIDSTNDYLKALAKSTSLENFTVVTTENQTNGKGQMGSKWVSEKGKNLTISILVKNILKSNQDIFILNVAVIIIIIDVLKEFNIPNVSVKWPNDIMADSKKLGGVLIENTIKSDGEIISIVGIGLNVNQINFPNLEKVTSMALELNKSFDTNFVMNKIVKNLEDCCPNIVIQKVFFWNKYHKNLFRINIPTVFELPNGRKIMGSIQNVTSSGQLCLLLEDETINYYSIKEIKMLY